MQIHGTAACAHLHNTYTFPARNNDAVRLPCVLLLPSTTNTHVRFFFTPLKSVKWLWRRPSALLNRTAAVTTLGPLLSILRFLSKIEATRSTSSGFCLRFSFARRYYSSIVSRSGGDEWFDGRWTGRRWVDSPLGDFRPTSSHKIGVSVQ